MKKLIYTTILLFVFCTNVLNSIELIEIDEPSFSQEEILLNVDEFINLPNGGISWKVFGETEMNEYTIVDKSGEEWMGVRPEFSEKILELDSKEILIQGYMFPLEQSEKQSLFLLGPFPISCPYHPHTSANLLIEVTSKNPILFTYDAVNIKGDLELVPRDDEYNIFFRLKNARLIKN